MVDMVEVVIDSIRVSLMSQQRLVILRESDADRYLVIWIGLYEAEAITMALQGVEVARPLTWDLLRSVFVDLEARVVVPHQPPVEPEEQRAVCSPYPAVEAPFGRGKACVIYCFPVLFWGSGRWPLSRVW